VIETPVGHDTEEKKLNRSEEDCNGRGAWHGTPVGMPYEAKELAKVKRSDKCALHYSALHYLP